MSSTFTPSTAVDHSKERDWSAQLGMLDWDNTNIVFTKRSLLEFLKYAGVTVDPNFTNIQKLPRYAQFGKLTAGAAPASEDSTASSAPVAAAPAASSAASDFKPTRRVREAPGGAHTNIFGYNDDDDALAGAPPKADDAISPSASADSQAEDTKRGGVAGLWDGPTNNNGFKPTRRVREMPGGKDSISGLF